MNVTQLLNKAPDARNQPIALLLRASLLLISIVISHSINASDGFVEATINGVPVNPLLFDAYQNNNLQDEKYCYPHTHKYIVQQVVEKLLIRNKGRDEGLESASRAHFEPLINAEPEDSDVRNELIATELISESRDYQYALIGDSANFDVKKKYLSMLEANHPLIVNVSMVRTAQLEFGNLIQAEEVLERLIVEEPFIEIAEDLQRTGEFYETKLAWWHHPATLPAPYGDEPLKVGSLIGPYFRAGSWQVRQVVEIKNQPVLLLNDEIDDGYSRLTNGIRNLVRNEQYQALVKDLWNTANIKLDGKSIPYPDNSYCGTPQI